MRRARSTTSRCEHLRLREDPASLHHRVARAGSRVRPPAHPTQSPKRLGAALIALALALSCTNGAEVRPLSPRAGLGAGAAGTTRLELRSLPERPVLAALVREGDPTAALALTLAMHADVAALAALGELLVSDLEAAGARSTLRVDRSSLTLVVAADAKSGAALFAAILGRLSRPLPTTAPSAKVRGRVADRLAAIPVEGAAAEVRLRGCLGQAGAAAPLALDLASAAGMQRVEAARRAAFTRERAAFAVVGPEAVASAIEGALERGEPWASSPAPTRGAEPPVAAASQTPRVGSGGARLHVAVRAADPLAAIAAAERLGRSPSALGARAGHLGFRVARAAGVADPGGGGCLALTLERGAASAASAKLGEEAAVALGLTIREAEHELERGPEALDVAARIAKTASPLEAAGLASFWALSHPDTSSKSGALEAAWLELPLDLPEAARADASSRLERAASQPAPLPNVAVEARLEAGQAEAWVVVANPCAAGEEAAHRWGTSSLAALAATPRAVAASYAHDAAARVDVEPLTSGAGTGFIAHAAPRPGEPAAALAERVARAAASGFFVEPASADELLQAHEVALNQVASRWTRKAPGLEALGDALDHPALLEPFGPPTRMARFESPELARRLVALSDGPIFVGQIALEDEAKERAAVAREISRWLTPSSRACESLPKLKAGRVAVTESRKGPTFLHVLVPLPAGGGSLARARVAAKILGEPDGLLQTIGGPTLKTFARAQGSARWVGLLVTLAGPAETVEAAEGAVLDLVRRLGRGEVPDAELVRALEAARAEDLERRSDPRARVAALLEGAASLDAIKASDVRAYLMKELSADAAALVLAKPE
ncbi:MAG: hypothetical protein IPM79_21545 [Polyangiaceae bacterium]|nr:hypothetical protein [Polyangiaceae bacterium]